MPINTNQTVQSKITNVNIDIVNQSVTLTVQNGIVENSVFTVLNTLPSVNITGSDAANLFTLQGTTGITLYSSLKAPLYDYLITQGIVTGTIV